VTTRHITANICKSPPQSAHAPAPGTVWQAAAAAAQGDQV
jgi:hypothetical protein